jgi:hypothetical protein
MIRASWKLLACLLTLVSTTAAMGKVSLRVDVGWNGSFRAGRWAPVYITAADDMAQPARNVIVQIIAPHDKTFALWIYNPATIRQDPTTILVYVPLTNGLDETVAMIKDPGSGKTLAELPFEKSQDPNRRGQIFYSGGIAEIILGVSGVAQHGLSTLKGQFRWQDESVPVAQPNQPTLPPPEMNVGYLEPSFLPDARVGYECLDALVLAAPDLVNIDQRRQEAIATWVRGGGRLIFWAGDGIVPPDSPIVKLLPAEIGEAGMTNLTLAETKNAGLASRIEKIPSRKLTPASDAAKLDLLGGKATAYFGRAGMGQVGVLSIDASKLIYNDSISGRKFWRPILHRVMKTREENTRNPYGYGWNTDASDTRRLAATERIVDRLGDVPGVGRFDFSYVALVLVGMMFIVGPVDWWVLRKLGKQEWTWVTTVGWIALITCSALYVGHVLKSGDLHYRTVRVIDQADGKVVGVLDMTGIYSPRTQAYNLDGPRECWWEPANVDFQPPWQQRQRTTSTIEMFQDRHGQRPLTRSDSVGNRLPAMIVNVWNLRFMQSELGDPSNELPLISSSLQMAKTGAEMRIRGTLSNRSSSQLQGISIATKAGTARVFVHIAAGQTVPIDVPIEPATVKAVDISQYSTYTYPGMNQQNPYASFGEELGFIVAATDMAADRAQRVLELLSSRDDLACIYGLITDAPPAVKLEYEQKAAPKEQHWQVVRALVPLGK